MATAREDDPSISGDMRLWRRIPNWPECYKFDEKSEQLRPSSINFRDDANELSVNLAAETTIEKVLKGHQGFGLVEFTAGLARQLLGSAVTIRRDPQPDNPGHALICGKVSKTKSAELAKKCQWVVEPGPPPDAPHVSHLVAEMSGTKPPAEPLWRVLSYSQGNVASAIVVLVILVTLLLFYFLSR